MHLAFVCHSYSPHRTGRQVLESHFTTVDWATALANAGLAVSVLYRFHSDEAFVQDGVKYLFVRDRLPAVLPNWRGAYSFHRSVAELTKEHKVDVIHTHNLCAFGPLMVLRRCVGGIPIVVQDHGGALTSRHSWLYRLGLRNIDSVMFAAEGQERAWVEAGVIRKEQCAFVMENASPFRRRRRSTARAESAMQGRPVFLWVGNLDQNKDPLTVLRAFEQVLEKVPEARLYMIYRCGKMEKDVKAVLGESRTLSTGVRLLGKVPRAQMEVHFNSADYLISASYKEGSGYAVIEAMACGVIPILSKIPSFEKLTHGAQVGALFDVGDSDMLIDAVITCMRRPIAEASLEVLDHYQEHLSFEAMVDDAKRVYDRLAARRRD